MAKKKAPKKAVKPKVDLEDKIAKLEAYLKQQVDIKNMGGDVFAEYPKL